MMKHEHDVVEIWHDERQLLVQVVHAQLLALLANKQWLASVTSPRLLT